MFAIQVVTIPPGVRKVLISNPPPLATYPADEHGAIARRVAPLHIDSKTWLPGVVSQEQTPTTHNPPRLRVLCCKPCPTLQQMNPLLGACPWP